MIDRLRNRRLPWLAAAFILSCVGARAQAVRDAIVPVPSVTGPIPVTANSIPFVAEDRNLYPVPLSSVGYVEEEFLVSGKANVYDWLADGSLTVKTSDAPYSTRILVRRPANPARFSGNVHIELMYGARRWDWAMMWGYSRDHFIESGDAWVGITMPNAAAALKVFDPSRYSSISYANPVTTACNPGAAVSATEEGLRWDAISQVAALLKSDAAGRPLGSMRVEGVFLSMQGSDVPTYVNAFHPNVRLANGKPVFDGYLLKSPTAPSRINQCATAPAAPDPRSTIRKTNVPVIAVVAQGEAAAALFLRRPDSDAVNDKFRMYEIAGGGHIDKMAYLGFPSFPEQIAAVGSAQGTPEFPFNAKCDPDIPLMSVPIMTYAFDAAYASLTEWARKGTAPPRSVPLEMTGAGTAEAVIKTDANGNGLGGIRNPYVDVPVATYFTNSTGPGNCREMGHVVPFNSGKFNALYGSTRAYANKVAQTADSLVKARLLTKFDAERIKKEAEAYAPK